MPKFGKLYLSVGFLGCALVCLFACMCVCVHIWGWGADVCTSAHVPVWRPEVDIKCFL